MTHEQESTREGVISYKAGEARRQKLVESMRARQMLDRGECEEAFQQRIIDLARTLGYAAYHSRNSQESEYGYPDLTLVNPRPGRRRLIFAEIKTETEVLRYSQEFWLTALRHAGGGTVETYCWRPSDWDQIAEILGPEEDHTGRTLHLRRYGGYAQRLTEGELLLGPRGVAELHGEIKR